MIVLLLDAAFRATEFVRIRLEDVDLSDCSIIIRAAVSKSRRRRVIWFGDMVRDYLQKYLEVRGKIDSPYLWLTNRKSCPSRNWLLQMVKRTGRRAGLGEVTVRMLRHTGLSLMNLYDRPIKYTQHTAGHQQVTTTENYIHLLADDLRRKCRETSPVDRLFK